MIDQPLAGWMPDGRVIDIRPSQRLVFVPETGRTIDVYQEGITIRVATSDDIAGVQHVASVTWRATYSGAIPERDIDHFLAWVYSTESLRQQIARFGDGFLVAESSGRIVGYAMSGVNIDREPELYALYVLPEQHGNGTGWMLWTATLACLARSGCTKMFCWVLASNVRARRFYERQGAILTEQRSFPIGATMVEEARYRVWIDPS